MEFETVTRFQASDLAKDGGARNALADVVHAESGRRHPSGFDTGGMRVGEPEQVRK